MNELFIGLMAGVVGVAYIAYGKKQTKLSAMVAGVLLCVYPYFFDSVLWLCVVGALLMAVPFVIDF